MSGKYPTVLHSEPIKSLATQFVPQLMGNSQVAVYDNAVHLIFIPSFFSSFQLIMHFNSMETFFQSYASQLLASQPSLRKVQQRLMHDNWNQLRH